MAHFVIGWLRNTSYYLFGSGSSGLGLTRIGQLQAPLHTASRRRVPRGRGVARARRSGHAAQEPARPVETDRGTSGKEPDIAHKQAFIPECVRVLRVTALLCLTRRQRATDHGFDGGIEIDRRLKLHHPPAIPHDHDAIRHAPQVAEPMRHQRHRDALFVQDIECSKQTLGFGTGKA
jgi:hypothetical protein